MEKVCHKFQLIIQEWRIINAYAKEIKKRNQQRMYSLKKTCLRFLSKNARVKKAERQENQFIQVFYYQKFLKKIYTILKDHYKLQQKRKSIIKHSVEKLQSNNKRRVLQEFRIINQRIKMQRNLSVTFGKDVVQKRIEKVMFKLWIEAIDNKHKTDKFFGFQLQKRVFDHFISVVKKNQWLK